MDCGNIDGRDFGIIVDSSSGWIEGDWVKDPGTAEAGRVLKAAFLVHGLCRTLVTDNGPALPSDEMLSFCRQRGINLFPAVLSPS